MLQRHLSPLLTISLSLSLLAFDDRGKRMSAAVEIKTLQAVVISESLVFITPGAPATIALTSKRRE